ncbi:PSD1 and planctomycete cytochrome C domain-containing protein [Novipirellula sp. SH528]|uniref:PSD1 and planctomycete cytochrome C domain-containing protein n=1 Tax=Novipirellula sp. SH528 TaxID=3454466 RepID=UPI003F9F262E
MNCFRHALFLLLLPTGTVMGGDRVEFNRDIRPILSDNCFYCHGFDEAHREAGLRLDTFEGSTESDAIVPGNPDESELVRRILSDDPDEIMPPPDSERHLTSVERELVKQWIEQGAEYQQHWAWKPLQRPAIPGTANRDAESDSKSLTGAAAIDAFLEAGWDDLGVSPAPPATPRERLRRLSFDLRGLAPTADEVAGFEANPNDEAFFEFRDRWMSELAYAEHQSVRWLDLVRWADTSGFVSDEPIASGAYRGWVIEAIGHNMPFDQFSIAQLAGDLLPNPTDDDLIASGYNRIVNTNCEAGAIEEEQLYKLKGEHVRAIGTVWMGLTTGCAECHDHKFDPILAKDYYSLAAFFDDLVEAGVYTPGDRREPLHYVYGQSTRSQQDKRLAEEIANLQREIDQKATDGLNEWQHEVSERLKDSKTRGEFVWIETQLPAVRVLEGDFDMTEVDNKLARETTAKPSEFRRHHAAELMTGYVNHGSFKTDAAKDVWYVDVWLDQDDRPEMIGIQISHGDYGRLGWKTANYETYYWGNDTSGVLDKPQPWSDPNRVKHMGELPDQSGWVRLRVPFADLIKSVSGQSFEAVGMAWLQSGGRVRWGDSGLELRTDKVTMLQLGETAIRKWWERPMNRQVYERRAEYVATAMKTQPTNRDDLQTEIVEDAFREQTQPQRMQKLRNLESQLGRLRSQAMPVLVSKQAETRKNTRLLNRGDYQDKTGPFVSASVPEFLGNSINKPQPDRLDLAQWLFHDENPLTARVYVNRLWHHFYGRGISDTLDDSGTQGEWPSNVALLDWLACEFRDSGWDRNHMVRLLTSTRSYQLSSKPSAELLERDPDNRTHARQHRFRLPAESIRDSALRAAGLLKMTTEIPTHSFYPYQPSPYWTTSDKVMFGSRHLDWETSREQSQYLRSMYTFWKRQNIHPTMLAFDAPTRQECTAKRNVTNTAGQALALLNDPIFVEAARVFASRVCNEAGSNDDAKLDAAFEMALQRRATEDEKQVLMQLLTQQRLHYRDNIAAANQLISIGQAPVPADVDPAELAAWTVVTRTILNLHEFLNRS